MSNQDNYDHRRSNPVGDQPMNFKYGESSSSNSNSQMNMNNPGQPATPRMLRSVSGSIRNSKSDINTDNISSPTPRYSEDFNQYVTTQAYRSHSRNPSFQQQQPTQPSGSQQKLNPSSQTFDPNMMTPQTPMHRRIPSNSYGQPVTPGSVQRQPSGQGQSVPATLNPNIINQSHQQTQNQLQLHYQNQAPELLPPVTINQPADSNTGGRQSSNNYQPSESQQSATSMPSTPKKNNHPAEPVTPNNQHHLSSAKDSSQEQKPFHRKSIGDWDFIKTIGAGSMGKVKLAKHNATGEICAVKIVPRAAKLYQRAHQNDPPPQNQQELQHKQKEYEKELARDRRTTREGVLGRLLFHPFVCRLYEIVPMTNHYYMLFEYVGGGQMLDYIVAHGSLKEKHTRKFARGIASALDYCHRNNVVHRDLKIENIMINRKGDIKVIDFGLSNLYSPKSLLKTYCGSLYFAAPELLCAKPYVGPEVDIWSFGIVLYVLVCGKVPFDDQSVSVLHEKIKKGHVQYPDFLSKDLVGLLSSMLQVDPTKRASLYEVISHPWINKGYDYPISNHLPRRIPLTLPLDDDIIKTIASLDLGNYQNLSDELNSIVGSVEYQMSTENWYKLMDQGRDYASASNSSILPDPTGGFHPLVSIYYLVDEMKKRKKAKEEAVKAQLQEVEKRKIELQNEQIMSQNNLPPNPSDLPLHDSEFNANAPEPLFETAQVASHRGTPQFVTEQPKPTPPPQMTPPPRSLDPLARARSSSLSQQPVLESTNTPPSISFPPQAHTTGSPATNNIEVTKEASPTPIPAQQPQSSHDSESNNKTINTLFRRLSKKSSKSKLLSPQRTPDVNREEGYESPSKNDPMIRRGVSMKVTAKERSAKADAAASIAAAEASKAQASSQTIRPIIKEPKRHNRSQSINVSNNGKHGFVPVEYLPPLPNIDTETNQIVPTIQATSASGRKLHPTARSKSLGGHIRRDSQSGKHKSSSHQPPLPNQMAAQNSDEMVSKDNEAAIYDGFFDDILLDDEGDVGEIPQLTEDEIIDEFNNAKPNSMLSIEYPKTIYLKGFFSVQTTSTKPLPVIRYNIINVLTRFGVKFQEVKGGFVCSHTPSLQHAIEDDNDTAYENEENEQALEEEKLYGNAFKSTSSSINERTKSPDHDSNSQHSDGSNNVPGTPQHNASSSSSNATTLGPRSRGPSRQPSLHLNTQGLSTPKGHKQSSSISSIGSERGHRRKFSIGNSILRKKNGSQNQLMPPNTPAAARINKLLYGDYNDDDLDEFHKVYTEDDSIDSVGNLGIGGGSDMLMSSRIEHRTRIKDKKSPLKFEIHVVKFPLVGLYGVQFKKLAGNTWNYKNLAGQILGELKL